MRLVKAFIVSLFLLLSGCSAIDLATKLIPSSDSGISVDTEVDTEVVSGDKEEQYEAFTSAVQDNQLIEASQVDSLDASESTTNNNFGLSNLQLMLVIFLAGLALPSFHEVLRLIPRKKGKA